MAISVIKDTAIAPAEGCLLLSSNIEKHVFGIIFSWLDPKDLVNFSCASEKCHQLVKLYLHLAFGRLEKICGFVNDTIVHPWNRHLNQNYRTLSALRTQRLLADQESSELSRLDPAWEHRKFFRWPFICQIAVSDPYPLQLLRACPQTSIGQMRRMIFSPLCASIDPTEKPALLMRVASTFTGKRAVNLDATRSCYAQLNAIIYSLLDKMGFQVNAQYTSPVEQIRELASNLMTSGGKQVQSPLIEEAIWSILSLLKGEEISTAEGACKKLIQHELSKLSSEEIKQIEKILLATFADVKLLFDSTKKIELNQRLDIRQQHLGRVAVEQDLVEQNNQLTGRALIHLSLSLCFVVNFIHPTRIELLPLIPLVIIPLFFAHSSKFILPWLPIRAEINNDGATETVRYFPHPLRSAVKVFDKMLLVLSVALVAVTALKPFLP